MIVRLMGDGQYRVDDGLKARLNELDAEIERAVTADDEAALWHGLAALAEAVRENGERLPDEDLTPSDAIVPPEDLTLEEAHTMLTGDGLIPDFPVTTA
jgi:hypothetical protein